MLKDLFKINKENGNYSYFKRMYYKVPIPSSLRVKVTSYLRKRLNGNYVEVKAFENVELIQDITWKIFNHISKTSIHISHVIVLPFLGTGGAEMTALNFSKIIALHGSQVLLVIADRQYVDEKVNLPEGISLICLDDWIKDINIAGLKTELLFNLVKLVRPVVFHNINSEVAWNLIICRGERLRNICLVVASIFAFQYTDRREVVGYAANFFEEGIKNVNLMLSDNKRFLRDAAEYFIIGSMHSKLYEVYNPLRISMDLTRKIYQAQIEFLKEKKQRNLKILWAGRLDNEKRIDILLELIRMCSFAEFYIYGQAVLNDGNFEQIERNENAFFKGFYSNPLEVMQTGPYDIFLFTSKWEGMPNVLVEFGAMGIPIIAPVVGGVGELVNDITGYPLKENADAQEYFIQIKAICENNENSAIKASNLRTLIESRHSFSAFNDRVKQLPGYMKGKADVVIEGKKFNG